MSKTIPCILPHHHDDNAASLIGHVPETQQIASVADAMKQLGDPSRLQIFWILCHSELCVANLAALVNMSSPAVSHHLRLLKDSGLVVTRRDGREMHYRAADTPLVQVLHRSIEEIVQITCPMRGFGCGC